MALSIRRGRTGTLGAAGAERVPPPTQARSLKARSLHHRCIPPPPPPGLPIIPPGRPIMPPFIGIDPAARIGGVNDGEFIRMGPPVRKPRFGAPLSGAN